jgi:hypothetical protein
VNPWAVALRIAGVATIPSPPLGGKSSEIV